MSYKYYNPNPKGQNVGDCTIRALTKALDSDWESVERCTIFGGSFR